jgi:acyl carrier protein
MSNKEKYVQAYVAAFSLEESAVNNDLKYNEIPEWDSIGHMALMAELEDAFGISMETDDIVEFADYTKGIEILAKYGVQI